MERMSVRQLTLKGRRTRQTIRPRNSASMRPRAKAAPLKPFSREPGLNKEGGESRNLINLEKLRALMVGQDRYVTR
jgi:hypothetical protein